MAKETGVPTPIYFLFYSYSSIILFPQYYYLQVAWYICFLPGLFFDPEDEGDIFLRNVGWLQQTIRRYIPEDRTMEKVQ
jgi:hypothetical protein